MSGFSQNKEFLHSTCNLRVFTLILRVGLKSFERDYYIISYPQIFPTLIWCLIQSVICFHCISILPFYIQLKTNTDTIPRVNYCRLRIAFKASLLFQIYKKSKKPSLTEVCSSAKQKLPFMHYILHSLLIWLHLLLSFF